MLTDKPVRNRLCPVVTQDDRADLCKIKMFIKFVEHYVGGILQGRVMVQRTVAYLGEDCGGRLEIEVG